MPQHNRQPVNQGKAHLFTKESLDNYFFDNKTTSVEDALLLMAGFTPGHVSVDWKQNGIDEDYITQTVQILDGFILNELITPAPTLTIDTASKRLENLKSEIQFPKITPYTGDDKRIIDYYLIKQLVDRADDAKSRLQKLWMTWNRYPVFNKKINLDHHYSPIVYIDWVKENNLLYDVVWWNDAVAHGLIQSSPYQAIDEKKAPWLSWLKRKTWSAKEGLLILTGHNPKQIKGIDWTSSGDLYCQIHHIERLWPPEELAGYGIYSRKQLNEELSFINREAQTNLNEWKDGVKSLAKTDSIPHDILLSLHDCRDNQRYEDCRKWLRRYEKAEHKLNKLITAWLDTSKELNDDRLAVDFFLHWIYQSGLYNEVPWWDAAISCAAFSESTLTQAQISGKTNKTTGKKPRANQIIHTHGKVEWPEIRFHFKDFFSVKISFPGKSINRNYKTLGFASKRNGDPTKSWATLTSFCYNDGLLEFDQNNSKYVSDLNQKLKKLFPNVVGNPFSSYKKGDGWKPNISCSFSKEFEDKNPHHSR